MRIDFGKVHPAKNSNTTSQMSDPKIIRKTDKTVM